MTTVSFPSSLCVAVAPYTQPALNVPCHALRRPAASALTKASSGKAAACFRHLALTSRSSASSRPGLVIANSLRGGGAPGRAEVQRGRARRPLRRFFVPGLVWVVALAYDYDLWWRRGPWGAVSWQRGAASAVSSRESNAGLLRFAWGRVAGSAVAYRWHFVCFHLLLGLTLLSHLAVTVANPGFFQPGTQVRDRALAPERWCDRCDRYKPPRAHHCGRCGACVARMDHHCVFAANCIGAGNHKQLLLLVIYAAACAAHTSFLLSRSSRRLPVLAPMVFCWLCALLVQQLYGIGVDAGTVDRLQAANSERRAAKRAAVPKTALASAPLPLLDKNRGLGLGTLRPDPMSTAAWNERTELAYRPSAGAACAANGFPAAGLPPGPFYRAAVDQGSVAALRGASFCRALWSSLREEILGEGPWVLWFFPTPAKLSPEAEARVYSPQ
eukprot:g17577.t1